MPKKKHNNKRNIIKEDTTQRIINNWDKVKQSFKSKITPIPRVLMLEVTNACNLKCIMCHNSDMIRDKGMMSKDLGKKAIKEAAKIGIAEIALYSTGEPLLYNHLEDLIVETKNNNLRCYLSSNGLLLNKELAEKLCISGLDSFKFSIDGVNSEEYETIRKNGCFKTLMNNVHLLKETRDRLHSSLKIICAMIPMKHNHAHISKFKKIFGPIADDVLISCLTNVKERYTNNKPMKSEIKNKRPSLPCYLLWDRIIMNYDGKITACCVDFNAELIYGNYNSHTLKELWQNNTIQKWREMHLSGNVDKIPLCHKCNAPFVFNENNLRKQSQINDT